MEIGREIRRLREAKGWSQAKLAGAADMGVSGISQIETGARNPSAATLSKIAEALGVEVRDLFPLEQPRLPDVPPGEAPIVKESAASAHIRTTATAKPQILYILQRVAKGHLSPEEGARLLEEINAA